MSKYIVVMALCHCYVWPIVLYEQLASCGRCDVIPNPLNYIISREEALEIFKERYGHYPEPITREQFA